MSRKTLLPLFAAAAALTALPALAQRDGTAGNPPSTATQRTLDRALDNPPTPADGTRGNPPGTAAGRAMDRALGNDRVGSDRTGSDRSASDRDSRTGTRNAPDGTPGNPPGTEASRAIDRATGSNTSGAYPGQGGGAPQR